MNTESTQKVDGYSGMGGGSVASTARVFVVGSYNVGLTVHLRELPVWGETKFGFGFSEGPGGKGSNQAVAAKRLGAEVHFLGCFGNDAFGDAGMSMLEQEGVNLAFSKRTDDAKTGVGIIYINSAGENCIVVDPGANSLLTAEDVVLAESAIANSDVLVVQLESAMPASEMAMRLARKHGKITIFNPAPANADCAALLSLATVITPNETELRILTRHPVEAPMDQDAMVEAARTLLQAGPETVIVTRGELGALIVTADGWEAVAAPTVDAVDTTGAGDCFSGALAVALGEGQSMPQAVEFACQAAAHSVTIGEVIPALPTREILEQGWA